MTKKYILTKEQKKKYELKRKQRFKNFTAEEKKLIKFKKKEYTKKNKEKIKARRKVRMLDPEQRKKFKEAQKRSKKRAKERNPLVVIGDHIKDSARNRNIEAPHKPLEYRKWYEGQAKLCYFCGNNNDTIKDYLKKIGEKVGIQQSRLHIERLDSTRGYIFDNLTLACSICNTHKSDIISAVDFKEIAKRYIVPKIKKAIE